MFTVFIHSALCFQLTRVSWPDIFSCVDEYIIHEINGVHVKGKMRLLGDTGSVLPLQPMHACTMRFPRHFILKNKRLQGIC